MLIQMTKSAYKKLCFEEKIPQYILDKYEFLPDSIIETVDQVTEDFWRENPIDG